MDEWACRRCGATEDAPEGGLPVGWSLASDTGGAHALCLACTRENVRNIEAKLDEPWW